MSEHDATIARLTLERDEAIKDRACYANALLAAQRELHRLTHGNAIEGDGVCEHELRANELRAELRRVYDGAAKMSSQMHRERSDIGAALEEQASETVRVRGERDTARRWSRLWHAEARRLWREVQAVSEEMAQDRVERLVVQLSGGDP